MDHGRLISHWDRYCHCLYIDFQFFCSDEPAAHFFFRISERYETGSIILTSNKSYGSWGEIFGDSVLATAILDRLLHHSTAINIKGESYRIKEKKKAGFFRPEGEENNSNG
ncbi:MAG: ATP-binding protein [Brevibacillus sp.]|nr:ATP-binding protein [Brevibacillus sp.]